MEQLFAFECLVLIDQLSRYNWSQTIIVHIIAYLGPLYFNDDILLKLDSEMLICYLSRNKNRAFSWHFFKNFIWYNWFFQFNFRGMHLPMQEYIWPWSHLKITSSSSVIWPVLMLYLPHSFEFLLFYNRIYILCNSYMCFRLFTILLWNVLGIVDTALAVRNEGSYC